MNIALHKAKIEIDLYICSKLKRMEVFPKRNLNIGSLIKEIIHYWRSTLLHQMLFSFIFFSVFFTSLYFFGTKLGMPQLYSGAIEKLKLGTAEYIREVQRINRTDAARTFYWVFTLTLVFLYPLNLGLFKIYRKLDLEQPVEAGDLFAGYAGVNFFIYCGFYLFWVMVYNLAFATIFLAVFWVFATLFCAPLMFFQNKRIFEGIQLSVKALRMYPGEIIICVMFAVFFRYAGIMSVFGAVVTFPIWNAVIYVLYKNMFVEPEQKIV